MKVGDLVRMKYEMWWKLRGCTGIKGYTGAPGIVYGIAGRGVKVLMPDNNIKLGLAEEWEIINAE